MAEEIKKDVVVDFKTNDADKVQKELEKTKEGVSGVNKETEKNTKVSEQNNKANKKTPGILKKVQNGIKGLGTAFKALGIGLVVALVAKLTEVLSKNQKLVDGFNVVMETVSNVINQVITAFQTAIESVNEATGGFESLQKVVSGLLTLGLTPLKTAFFGVKLGIQQAMLAWEESFFGDNDQSTIDNLNAGIKETKESLIEVGTDALKAGKDIAENYGGAISELGQLGTSVADNLQEVSVTAAKESANQLVELRKQAQLAEAQLAGLTLKFQQQAEQQRQVRDDVSKSIEDRIEANRRLGEILEQQSKEELALANQKLTLAKEELALNPQNIDAQVKLQEALNGVADVEERITGQKSEQLTNEKALQDERTANLNELRKIGKTEVELSREEAQQKFEAQKQLIDRTISDEKRKNEFIKQSQLELNESLNQIEAEEREKQLEAEQEEQERLQGKFESELEKEKQNFQTRFDLLQQQRQQILNNEKINEDQRTALLKANSEARIKVEEAETQARQQLQDQVTQNVLNGAAALGDALGFGKEVAIAGALINTFEGIAAGVKLGFPLAIPAVAAATATGFAAVKNITSTDLPAPPQGATGGRGRSSGGATATPPPTPPSFNLVGQANTSSITQSENIGQNQPVNAVVVSREVSSQQQADRNAQEQSTF